MGETSRSSRGWEKNQQMTEYDQSGDSPDGKQVHDQKQKDHNIVPVIPQILSLGIGINQTDNKVEQKCDQYDYADNEIKNAQISRQLPLKAGFEYQK